jgi:hypothetical protein
MIIVTDIDLHPQARQVTAPDVKAPDVTAAINSDPNIRARIPSVAPRQPLESCDIGLLWQSVSAA